MSNSFGDREKGFERKFQLDADQQFRANARRDKLFGLWAASKLGKTAADADAYAASVVDSNFEKPGDDDMLGKVRADFQMGNVVMDGIDLPLQLRECAAIAARQIAEEAKK